MTGMKSLFMRMEKAVRSYTEKNPDKSIAFHTAGESTELDKRVMDMLGEPLIHLIRNGIDHGIETREKRIAAWYFIQKP
jgi:two-component system chemotaxis sensor kinase CheA